MTDTMHGRVCASRQRNGVASAVLAFVTLLMSVVLACQSAQGQTLTVIYAFKGGADGANPSGVILDAAGNLYGTTGGGGAYNFGTVFKLDPAGHESVLHSFTGPPDGSSPDSGLLRDAQGNFYGTSASGGTYNGGTVFKLDTAGHESVLYSHNSFGVVQAGVLDNQGSVYGTTSGSGLAPCILQGRPGQCGTVFKVDAAGNYSLLFVFKFWRCNGQILGPLIPEGTLLRDAAGNLFGTTRFGGAYPVGSGTVFKLSTSGCQIVHAFGGISGSTDGANPAAGLIADAAGKLYGTTAKGGTSNLGTVFKLDTAGHESVLYSFAGGSDGANPAAALVLDAAGNLYGTTGGGGAYNFGTVFKLDATGHETVLHTFTGGMDGANPYAGLLLDAAGNLYGATPGGGAYGFGTVFRINGGFHVVPGLNVSQSSLNFGDQPIGSTATETLTLTNGGSTSISGISLTVSSLFNLSGGTCGTALAAGASCVIGIGFTPTGPGAAAGTLTISSSSPSNLTLTVPLSGVGISAGIGPVPSLAPSSLSFGNVLAGTISAPQSATLTNVGNAPLTILSMTYNDNAPGGFFGRFYTTTCGPNLSIAPGSSCTISIDFEANAAASGPQAGSVIVNFAAGGSATLQLSANVIL